MNNPAIEEILGNIDGGDIITPESVQVIRDYILQLELEVSELEIKLGF